MEIKKATHFLANLWSFPVMKVNLKDYKIPKKTTDVNGNIDCSRHITTSRESDSKKKRDVALVSGSEPTNVKASNISRKRRLEQPDSDEESIRRRKSEGRKRSKRRIIEDEDEDVPYRIVSAADSEQETVIRTVEQPFEEALDNPCPVLLCEDGSFRESDEAALVTNHGYQRCAADTGDVLLSETTVHVESTCSVESIEMDLHTIPTRPQTPEAVSSLSEPEKTSGVLPESTPDSAPVLGRSAVQQIQQILMKVKRLADALTQNSKEREAVAAEHTTLLAERKRLRDETITLRGKVANGKHITEEIKEMERIGEDTVRRHALREAEIDQLIARNSEMDYATYEAMVTAAMFELSTVESSINSVNEKLEELRREEDTIRKAAVLLENFSLSMVVVEKRIELLEDELKRLEAEELQLRADHKDAEDEWAMEKEKRRRALKILPSVSFSPVTAPAISQVGSTVSPTPIVTPTDSRCYEPISAEPVTHRQIAECRSTEVQSPDSATSPSTQVGANQMASSAVPVKVEPPLQRQAQEDSSKKLSSLFSKTKTRLAVKKENALPITLQKDLLETFQQLVYYVLEILPVTDDMFESQWKSFLSMMEDNHLLALPVLYSHVQKKESSNIGHVPYHTFELAYKERIARVCSNETQMDISGGEGEEVAEGSTTSEVTNPVTAQEAPEQPTRTASNNSTNTSFSQIEQPSSISVQFPQFQVSWSSPATSAHPSSTHSEHFDSPVTSQYMQQTSLSYPRDTRGSSLATSSLPSSSPSSQIHVSEYQQPPVRVQHQQFFNQHQVYASQPPVCSPSHQTYVTQNYYTQQPVTHSQAISQTQTAVNYTTQLNSYASSYGNTAASNLLHHQQYQQQLRRQYGTTVAGNSSSYIGGNALSVLEPQVASGSKCAVCSVVSTQVCARCNTASYCSKDCQVLDWPRHRMTCGQQVMRKSPNPV